MKRYFFDCICYSSEHTLQLDYENYDEEENCPPTLSFNVHLGCYPGIWQRFWIAVKYVFGYKCKYGHFDTFILNRKDAERLKGYLETFIKDDEKVKRPKSQQINT